MHFSHLSRLDLTPTTPKTRLLELDLLEKARSIDAQQSSPHRCRGDFFVDVDWLRLSLFMQQS